MLKRHCRGVMARPPPRQPARSQVESRKALDGRYRTDGIAATRGAVIVLQIGIAASVGRLCPCTRSQRAHIPSTWMVYGWYGMVEKRSVSAAESEKITINLGYVDLGHIDLLVNEGFYSNRSDFIRTAIRHRLDRHADVVEQSVARRQLNLGLRRYDRAELEAVRTTGELIHIQVLGLAVIAPDVSVDLARATIASIQVLGALQASAEIKAALRDRIR